MDRVHKKFSYLEEWGDHNNKESVYTNYISMNLLGGFATNFELGKSIKIHLPTRDSTDIGIQRYWNNALV